MTTSSLNVESALAKVDRAVDLYRTFEAEVTELLSTFAAATALLEQTPLRQEWGLRGAPDVPPHSSLLVGDIVHNLRSALDHLAWSLVEASGGTPSRRRPSTAFPIHVIEPSSPPTIQPCLADRFLRVLVQAQPYVEFAEHTPRKSPLFIVSELDNIDKHIAVVPVVGVLGTVSWSVPPERRPPEFVPAGGPVGDGEHIGTFLCDGNGLSAFGPTFSFELRAAPAVPFPELQTGDLCHWALGVSTHFVRGVINRFVAAN